MYYQVKLYISHLRSSLWIGTYYDCTADRENNLVYLGI